MSIREITNAERAARAEAALLAYIAHTGDSIKGNGVDTWVGDLLCDLRHFADQQKFDFNPNAGLFNYEAETIESPMGQPERAANWYVEGRPARPRTQLAAETAGALDLCIDALKELGRLDDGTCSISALDAAQKVRGDLYSRVVRTIPLSDLEENAELRADQEGTDEIDERNADEDAAARARE